MLKPRYNLTLDASCLFVGRAGKYDVWAEPAGIVTIYPAGIVTIYTQSEGTTAVSRHSWSRFRSGVFSHWPENLKMKLLAMAAMMEEVS